LKNFTIKYLSNGPRNTGGYFHEKFWFEQVQELYTQKGYKVEAQIERPDFYHKGFKQLFFWFLRLFKMGNADLLIVPSRCALPVLLRNIFSKNKVWVIFHILNNKELKKSKLNAMYYALVLKLIKRNKEARLVTVAEFWKTYFNERMGIPSSKILVLYNLFDATDYSPYWVEKKDRSIFLGMWSTKLDKSIYELASRLSHRGYFCFFTSPDDIMTISAYGYEIIYCETISEYKERIARAMFTLSFAQTPEGWSRVSHESFLLNTPVIGSDNAGQGELIREANGFLVDNVMDAIELIDLKPSWKLSEKFTKKFDKSNSQNILKQYL